MEALWYRRTVSNAVDCRLCPRRCQLGTGARGACLARKNQAGVLQTLNYGYISCLANDPIEKKPLYHFNPGTKILSLGSFGCNLHCLHCQNSDISQADERSTSLRKLSVNDLAYLVREEGVRQVAFTYNEPLIWYEYVLEASQLLKKAGVQIVLVTNGYINAEPLAELLPYTDAWSLDIKWAFDSTAQKLSGVPKAQPVLDTARAVYVAKKHLEIVTNIVPGYNDSTEELEHIAKCIVGISPDIPWHVSRAFPQYKWQGEPTLRSVLETAVAIGTRVGLRTIHQGNI